MGSSQSVTETPTTPTAEMAAYNKTQGVATGGSLKRKGKKVKGGTLSLSVIDRFIRTRVHDEDEVLDAHGEVEQYIAAGQPINTLSQLEAFLIDREYIPKHVAGGGLKRKGKKVKGGVLVNGVDMNKADYFEEVMRVHGYYPLTYFYQRYQTAAQARAAFGNQPVVRNAHLAGELIDTEPPLPGEEDEAGSLTVGGGSLQGGDLEQWFIKNVSEPVRRWFAKKSATDWDKQHRDAQLKADDAVYGKAAPLHRLYNRHVEKSRGGSLIGGLTPEEHAGALDVAQNFQMFLKEKTVPQLREIVKGINVRGRIVYTKLKKAQLIEEIIKHADMLEGEHSAKIYTKGWRVKPVKKAKKAKGGLLRQHGARQHGAMTQAERNFLSGMNPI